MISPESGVIPLTCRLVLAAVFVGAAVGKWRSGDTFVAAVQRFGVGSHRHAGLIAGVIFRLELLVGILLLMGIWRQMILAVALVLLIVFTTVTVVKLSTEGPGMACGCFGKDSRLTWASVWRNLSLIAAAVTVADVRHGTLFATIAVVFGGLAVAKRDSRRISGPVIAG